MKIYEFLSYNQYPMQRVQIYNLNSNCVFDGILRDMPHHLRESELMGFMVENDIIEIYYTGENEHDK